MNSWSPSDVIHSLIHTLHRHLYAICYTVSVHCCFAIQLSHLSHSLHRTRQTTLDSWASVQLAVNIPFPDRLDLVHQGLVFCVAIKEIAQRKNGVFAQICMNWK